MLWTERKQPTPPAESAKPSVYDFVNSKEYGYSPERVITDRPRRAEDKKDADPITTAASANIVFGGKHEEAKALIRQLHEDMGVAMDEKVFGGDDQELAVVLRGAVAEKFNESYQAHKAAQETGLAL